LNAQVNAHALLLVGSTEPHYTPSKVFPALLTGRPIVGIYHAASPVVDILRRDPLSRVVAVADGCPVDSYVPAIAEMLEWSVDAHQGGTRPQDAWLHEWSAATLAGTLAGVLDRVTA
jgi:hypothetical protein